MKFDSECDIIQTVIDKNYIKTFLKFLFQNIYVYVDNSNKI